MFVFCVSVPVFYSFPFLFSLPFSFARGSRRGFSLMKALETFGYGTRTPFKMIFSYFSQVLVGLCNITILCMKLHMVMLWCGCKCTLSCL